MCSTCGNKHSPPRGKKCTYVIPLEDPEEELEEISESEVGGTVTVANAVSELTATVQLLSDDLASLRRDLTKPGDESDTSIQPAVPDVTLPELRAMPQLNARVDSLMNRDTSTDLVNLHYLTGGKLLKSPRDAPVRRIVRTVLWPNQFVSRLVGSTTVLKFDDLSLPEFSLGGLKIIQLSEIPLAEKTARIQHMEHMMSLARHYAWPSIRAMYAVVLEDIQYGNATWGDPIQPYKDAHLLPSNLLPAPYSQAQGGGKLFRTSTQDIPVSQLCRKFNFDTCTRLQCPYKHFCMSCLRARGEKTPHATKDCPRSATRPAPYPAISATTTKK